MYVFKLLKDNKIGVREFNSPGLREYLRVTVGTEEENKKFIDTLKSVKGKAWSVKREEWRMKSKE